MGVVDSHDVTLVVAFASVRREMESPAWQWLGEKTVRLGFDAGYVSLWRALDEWFAPGP